MAQDVTSFKVTIGDEPTNPGLQFNWEIIMGGNEYDGKLSAVAEEIGEFLPLVGYVVIKSVSSEAATDLATFLQSTIDNMFGGSISQSLLVSMFPTIQLPPSSTDKIFHVNATTHHSNVVIKVSANEELNEQANLVVSRSSSEVEALFENEHGLKIDIESSASVPAIIGSDNPVMTALENFKISLELRLAENSLETIEQPLAAGGVPPQIMQYFGFVKLFHALDFGLALTSPSQLPNQLKDQVRSTDDVFKGLFQMVQMIPEEFRSIIEKLADDATGSVELYLHHKAFLKLVIVARGASELLKAN